MNKYTGIKCEVCGVAFGSGDNIAVCPDCGTPHHYDCYHAQSRCVNEHRHQYDYTFTLPEENPPGESGESGRGHVCPRCRQISTSDTLFCPYCGYAFGNGEFSAEEDARLFNEPVTPFSVNFTDPLGGVDPAESIDGIPVSDMTLFIGPNTQRYLPKFVNFCRNSTKKLSWNWLSFLFPHMWFAGRKMYKQAILASILNIAFSLFNLPFLSVLNNIEATLDTSQTATSSQLYSAIIQKILADPGIMPLKPLFIALLGALLMLTLRILCGLFGDFIYKQYAVNKIHSIKEGEDTDEQDIRSGGGVNIFSGLLFYLAVTQISNIIMMMIF